jgi:hypothetical protein
MITSSGDAGGYLKICMFINEFIKLQLPSLFQNSNF